MPRCHASLFWSAVPPFCIGADLCVGADFASELILHRRWFCIGADLCIGTDFCIRVDFAIGLIFAIGADFLWSAAYFGDLRWICRLLLGFSFARCGAPCLFCFLFGCVKFYVRYFAVGVGNGDARLCGFCFKLPRAFKGFVVCFFW